MNRLARHLLSRPVKPVRSRLRLTELEARAVPAWWSVSSPDPAEGIEGVTDADHQDTEFVAHPDELPDGNGGVLVEADTAEEAVALAATGSVTAYLGGESATYTFGPHSVGASAADEKPFLVTVTGDQATVHLEDLVGFPDATPDWDYDDRSWGFTVSETAPPDELVDSGSFVWAETRGLDQTEERVTVHFRVTTEDDGAYFRWQYRLVNHSLSDTEIWSYLEHPGAQWFRVGPEGFDFSAADDFTATNKWTTDADPYADPLTWSPVGGYPGPNYLPKGQEATFTFRTPPQPVGLGQGAVGADAEAAGLEGPLKGPAAPPVVTISSPKFVPVNANNDNFRPLVAPDGVTVTNESDRWRTPSTKYIPKKRDFDATNLWQKDDELLPVTFTVSGNLAGTLTFSADPVGNTRGVAKFWKDQKKTVQIGGFSLPAVPQGQQRAPIVAYIEGAHESDDVDDIRIKATFTAKGIPYHAVPEPIAVTPIVKSFTAKTGSVMFKNGEDMLSGITTLQPGVPGVSPSVPGIDFTANVWTGGWLRMTYVQNMSQFNGTAEHGVLGGPGLVAVAPAESLVYRISNEAAGFPHFAGFPLLDADAPAANPASADGPEYGANVQVMEFGRVRVKTEDSPEVVPEAALRPRLSKIDTVKEFVMYLVTRYSDGSIYAVANMEWNVLFHAANKTEQGVTKLTLLPDSKVQAKPAVINNAQPTKTVPPVPNGRVPKQTGGDIGVLAIYPYTG